MNAFLHTPARISLAAVVAAGLLTGCSPSADARGADATQTATIASAPASIDLSAELEQLESESDARIGVSAFDTGTGQTVSYGADDRFGFASSFKAFVAGGFLLAVPVAERDTVVTWTQEDIDAAGYSPITSEHISDGLTLSQLAEAAVRASDNTATNIILRRIGGPAGLQEILRQAGDNTSQIVNYEPDLNIIEPGSTDDTTTPAAFAAGIGAFLTGTVLAASDKAMLMEWMSGNPSGDPLIRAGAPEGWTVADKSGGAYGIRNDIAIITPPDREPIILTILTLKNAPDAEYENATVADTAKVVLDALK
ncbi:class A beta-lactamase [Microbacterium oxydans]|uniref:class A beta-lactamase n=1 Tax=Microbacterium oxydans TaxID=82380 RepID=UPI00226B237E|nr:class A beta-lactamase [Microbacterium oxydans]WAA65603.1 class A beta-lactamase [Microbacterium oxydans]